MRSPNRFACALALCLAGRSGTPAVALDGTLTLFDVPGEAVTIANGINDAAQVVGHTSSARGFLKDGNSYSQFSAPGAAVTVASDINSAAQIVGDARNGVISRGFIKTGSTYSLFDYPGATTTFAFGNNDLGQIVGVFRNAGDQYTAKSTALYDRLSELCSASSTSAKSTGSKYVVLQLEEGASGPAVSLAAFDSGMKTPLRTIQPFMVGTGMNTFLVGFDGSGHDIGGNWACFADKPGANGTTLVFSGGGPGCRGFFASDKQGRKYLRLDLKEEIDWNDVQSFNIKATADGDLRQIEVTPVGSKPYQPAAYTFRVPSSFIAEQANQKAIRVAMNTPSTDKFIYAADVSVGVHGTYRFANERSGPNDVRVYEGDDARAILSEAMAFPVGWEVGGSVSVRGG